MIIKRVGGKSKIADWIVDNLPSCSIFVDVFGGSGVVLDTVKIRCGKNIRYVYNDLDEKIFTFFKMLQNKPECLSHFVNCTPYSRSFFEEAKEIASNPKKYADISDIDKALIFLIVNRQSFGSKMDTWSITREGEVNYETWKTLPSEIINTHQRWKSVYLENLDYRDLIKKWDSQKTVFYLDPPYEGVESDYYDVNKLLGFDHQSMLTSLQGVCGSFVVSYYGGKSDIDDSDLIKQYSNMGCKIIRQKVSKHLSKERKKDRATEILIIKENDWSMNSGIYEDEHE